MKTKEDNKKKYEFQPDKLVAGFSLIDKGPKGPVKVKVDSEVYVVGVYVVLYVDDHLASQSGSKSSDVVFNRKARQDINSALNRGATDIEVWYRDKKGD